MTPTLAGRWQTRAALIAFVGLPVCYAFGRAWGDPRTTVTMLAYVLVLGLVWDLAYQYLQGYRWDQDWPVYLQAAACLWEGIFLWVLLGAAALWGAFGMSGPPGMSPVSAAQFATHYGTVWILMFATVQGPVKVLFPKWRFSGGRFV